MTQATESTGGSTEDRPDDQTLLTIDTTATAENYTDHDSRHEQNYWGSLVLNFPVKLDARGLPPYAGEEGKWARDIWSKFNYMLGSVCTMAQQMARLNIAGLAHPSEIGLDESARSLDFQSEVPSEFDLAEDGNPITGDPYRPFDELKALELMVDLTYSRFPEQGPEDDFLDAVVKLELRARVERPSMIPSKTELRGAVSQVKPHIFPPVRFALARAMELARRRAKVRRNVHISTNVARIWSDHFLEEASEKINYQERLDALREELREEIGSQVEDYFEETSEEELAEDMKAPVTAIRTAKRVWDNYVHVRSGLSPATSNVDPAEVMKDLRK